MTLSASQGEIWKRISEVYTQWDPERNGWMPVHELQAKLPEVAPELIGETLAQAAEEAMAEVGHVGESPGFRPLQY